MTYDVTSPDRMNAAFARAFNSRSLDHLLRLYEPDAILRIDGSATNLAGIAAIEKSLVQLLRAPGQMHSHNNFCIVHGELALLRADWRLVCEDGTIVTSGSSTELVRRQPDGRWLYMIDHAAGASLPRLSSAEKAI